MYDIDRKRKYKKKKIKKSKALIASGHLAFPAHLRELRAPGHRILGELGETK